MRHWKRINLILAVSLFSTASMVSRSVAKEGESVEESCGSETAKKFRACAKYDTPSGIVGLLKQIRWAMIVACDNAKKNPAAQADAVAAAKAAIATVAHGSVNHAAASQLSASANTKAADAANTSNTVASAAAAVGKSVDNAAGIVQTIPTSSQGPNKNSAPASPAASSSPSAQDAQPSDQQRDACLQGLADLKAQAKSIVAKVQQEAKDTAAAISEAATAGQAQSTPPAASSSISGLSQKAPAASSPSGPNAQ